MLQFTLFYLKLNQVKDIRAVSVKLAAIRMCKFQCIVSQVPRMSVGDEAGTCNMSTSGDLFYHNTKKSLLFCDSEHWVEM